MSQPPLYFRPRGVIVCSWVEKSLHNLPTQFLSWPQFLSFTSPLQLRRSKLSQSGAQKHMLSAPKSSQFQQSSGALISWATWYKRLLSLVMLSVNSIASMHTLISKVSHSVLSHWQFSWDSWPMKAHSLYTPTAMKSLRILTTSVTRLDHILSMLDI